VLAIALSVRRLDAGRRSRIMKPGKLRVNLEYQKFGGTAPGDCRRILRVPFERPEKPIATWSTSWRNGARAAGRRRRSARDAGVSVPMADAVLYRRDARARGHASDSACVPTRRADAPALSRRPYRTPRPWWPVCPVDHPNTREPSQTAVSFCTDRRSRSRDAHVSSLTVVRRTGGSISRTAWRSSAGRSLAAALRRQIDCGLPAVHGSDSGACPRAP
jgi:hypothetical protein